MIRTPSGAAVDSARSMRLVYRKRQRPLTTVPLRRFSFSLLTLFSRLHGIVQVDVVNLQPLFQVESREQG